MRRYNIILSLFLFLVYSVEGLCQIHFSVGDTVPSELTPVEFEGDFKIVDIRRWELSYLISVVSVDTLKTNAPEICDYNTVNLPFTIISFKDESTSNRLCLEKNLLRITHFYKGHPPFFVNPECLIVEEINENKENVIHVGDVCKLNLSPYGRVWSVYNNSKDDWHLSFKVRHPSGHSVKIPLPLIENQLMVSTELKGLRYIHTDCNKR
ncbi:MAG: hypothetical protein J5711_04630 [Bacteroidales bacterium]|nr:hypothetical protein [Bacteroidales bacterium]